MFTYAGKARSKVCICTQILMLLLFQTLDQKWNSSISKMPFAWVVGSNNRSRGIMVKDSGAFALIFSTADFMTRKDGIPYHKRYQERSIASILPPSLWQSGQIPESKYLKTFSFRLWEHIRISSICLLSDWMNVHWMMDTLPQDNLPLMRASL